MNWGAKIATIYLGFVSLMVVMVTLCLRQTDIHLVSKDYYKQEIAYQSEIDKATNVAKLPNKPRIELNANRSHLLIRFPDAFDTVTGEVQLFRPSNAHLDRMVKLTLDSANQQAIAIQGLAPGFWKIKLNWRDADKPYYLEQRLIF
jgi:nitrogen fixation protein FixH